MSLRLSGGRRLHSPPGDTARPTPSRVRLAVMNMLQGELAGASWLDLCCGSGVMACEAIQRGADRVVAVDQDRRMAATARTNLQLVAASRRPEPSVRVVQQEVVRWLRAGRAAADLLTTEATATEGFDLIYADPPYAAELYGPLMAAVAEGDWIKPSGTLVLECATARKPELEPGWSLERERHYGSTTLLMLSRG